MEVSTDKVYCKYCLIELDQLFYTKEKLDFHLECYVQMALYNKSQEKRIKRKKVITQIREIWAWDLVTEKDRFISKINRLHLPNEPSYSLFLELTWYSDFMPGFLTLDRENEYKNYISDIDRYSLETIFESARRHSFYKGIEKAYKKNRSGEL